MKCEKFIMKNLQERKNLSQPINFAGTVYQRHISQNNVSQIIDAKLTNVGNTIIFVTWNQTIRQKSSTRKQKLNITSIS